ncbi:hypothetical protein J2800_003285 [Caulobacter rhizosphaerae]|jgi:hypothetical protein|uniref:Type III secretion system (T3SS) protein HpaP n=1 Tax=Caulobacter rhizosphaerae TaxID=2010972 RepID=A0ABU1N262_9CAUL|nr:hypothetical protein [Caulobacter rhizosphaerae]MDR6532527.1 hypothetical protein [Caulobacter rhizosphaerae]
MTTTRDVSTAERPTTPQPRPTSEPATPWRGGEFHAALQQAAERHAPLARQPSRAEREDEDRTEDGADLAALFGPAHDFKGADAATTDKAPVDGVGTPGAAAHGAAEPVVIQLPAGATSAEIEAFAAAMEKAWLAAGGNASKGVAMGLADRGSPLTGLGLARGADGSLSLTLAAHPNATPEVTKALEALRKRLEVRGLTLADLQVEADDGDFERLIPKVR